MTSSKGLLLRSKDKYGSKTTNSMRQDPNARTEIRNEGGSLCDLGMHGVVVRRATGRWGAGKRDIEMAVSVQCPECALMCMRTKKRERSTAPTAVSAHKSREHTRICIWKSLQSDVHLAIDGKHSTPDQSCTRVRFFGHSCSPCAPIHTLNTSRCVFADFSPGLRARKEPITAE